MISLAHRVQLAVWSRGLAAGRWPLLRHAGRDTENGYYLSKRATETAAPLHTRFDKRPAYLNGRRYNFSVCLFNRYDLS